VGYNLIVEEFGALVLGRPLDVVPAANRGHNLSAIAICVVGDNTTLNQRWTASQVDTLKRTVSVLKVCFPDAVVLGHRDLANTATLCPGIDIRNLLCLNPLDNEENPV
jgi:hypothetical protein